MKTFQEFAEEIQSNLSNLFGQEYSITLTETQKNNGLVLTGVVIHKEEEIYSPTLYLDEYYKEYQAGTPIRFIITTLLREYEERVSTMQKVEYPFDVERILDLETVTPRICYKLINREMNLALLEDTPFLPWEDLAITFYILVDSVEEHTDVITIKQHMMEAWGLNVNDMWELAKENTERLFPCEITNIMELMSNLLHEPDLLEECPDMPPIFICSNPQIHNGAGVMLYDGVLEGFANYYGCDFYILPSTIHETILVPETEGLSENILLPMVRDVNTTRVPPEDILSDKVYYYDKERKHIQAHELEPEEELER